MNELFDICHQFGNIICEKVNYNDWNINNIDNYIPQVYLINNLSLNNHIDTIISQLSDFNEDNRAETLKKISNEIYNCRKHDFLTIQRYLDIKQEYELNKENDEKLIYNWLLWYSCQYILGHYGNHKAIAAIQVAVRGKLYTLDAITFMAMTKDIAIKGELFYFRQLRLINEQSCIDWMKDRLITSSETIDRKVKALSDEKN